jgi:hypothetical protein
VDDLMLRHCPKHKLTALLDALRAAQRRRAVAPPPAPPASAPAPPSLWAVAARAGALGAAPPHLRDLALAPPFRALTEQECSRQKPGPELPELVRDAVKAWHLSRDLRYAIVVTPDPEDLAHDLAAAARADQLHASAASQRTVLSGCVGEVAELLRVMAGGGSGGGAARAPG